MLLMLRVTLLCLLALAIPAQGFAAAARLLCGPAHHGTASMPAHEPASAHAHHHDHAEKHSAVSGSPSSTLADHPAEGRCIACAACCTAMALPVAPPLLMAPPLLSATPLALAAAPCPAFITGGPDRPPRPFLA